jgi:hypothetical protein
MTDYRTVQVDHDPFADDGYRTAPVDQTSGTPVHSIKITPELRNAAMSHGFPLFYRGGRVRAVGGRVEKGKIGRDAFSYRLNPKLAQTEVRCENCKFMASHGRCGLYVKLNRTMSSIFDLDEMVEPRGRCDAFEPGGNTPARADGGTVASLSQGTEGPNAVPDTVEGPYLLRVDPKTGLPHTLREKGRELIKDPNEPYFDPENIGRYLGEPSPAGLPYPTTPQYRGQKIRIAESHADGGPARQRFAHGGRVEPGNINRRPTDGQKEAGNYAKDHLHWNGLPLTIENAKNSHRSGVGKDGKPWKSKLPAHYGYVKGTKGKDGDHVDMYLGPHAKAPMVYVVDQKNHETGRFDEHKAMGGFANQRHAQQTYERAFSDGKGEHRIGAITAAPVAAFKRWLDEGDTTKPFASQHPRIDGTHTVLSGANSELDGTVVVDHRIPQKFWKYLAIHETIEAKCMAEGMKYPQAHKVATAAERKAVEADRISWRHYTAEIDGYLAKIEHEKNSNPPTAKLHVDPAKAIGHHHSSRK